MTIRISTSGRKAAGGPRATELTGTTPTIESDRTYATVSFPLKSAIQRGNDNVGKNVGKILTDRQQKILELVTDNPTISMAEMARIIGVTTKTIERETPNMEGIIHHMGPKNGGYWEIIGDWLPN